jgi:anti-sigma B factor antagonist
MEMQGSGGAQEDTISFAELGDGVIVVRVWGRGSFLNSMELKELADRIAATHGPGNYHFIVDLGDCSTMDSTFMGTLASIGLRQRREGSDQLTVVNANEQSFRLLQTLGLAHFICVRKNDCAAADHAANTPDENFQPADRQSASRTDRIIHMIEAHEKLVDADSDNAVRFESVLKYLRDSLEREKNSAKEESAK